MFSWPFGKKKAPGDAALEAAMGDAGAGGGPSKNSESGGPWDPSGLERAAKAVRELNASPHADRAYDLVQEQERTKQHDMRVRHAEQELNQLQYEVMRVKAEAEEHRKTIGVKTERAKENADYADKLERERYVQQAEYQQAQRAQELKEQEAAVERQEAARKKTIEYQHELEKKRVLAKVEAEVTGKIEQERKNHDLILEKTKAEGAEARQTRLESIRLASETFGAGVREFLVDKERMTAAVGIISALAVGVYGAKVSTGVIGRYIEARLGKPSLVRETSRTSMRDALRAPVPTAQRALGMSTTDGSDALGGVVLQPRLEERLRRVATATANTKRNRAPFRHLLLHGPPGTGKTLFAKGLAKHSGLEYAVLTGGDVAPLGREGVTEIHKLFDWATTSRRGLLLFIDEADAFLRRRSEGGGGGEKISEDLRNALNAFLYRTGETSDKFMLVYASNQPEQFDWAVNDRIDEMVEFELPGHEERTRMIELYLDKYLRAPPPSPTARRIVVDESLTPKHVAAAVDATDGFSGREISKLAIAWQAASYGSADARFTPEIMASVLEVHVAQRERKREWQVAAGM